MNILVPDSWLRKFLKTKATPSQLKEYLSLCGPSVERIYEESGEPVYDIEITTNRPDAMSVFGVAREASVILPRFGVAATLLHDPYATKSLKDKTVKSDTALSVTTDPSLNPRWTSVIIKNTTVKDSPKWLTDWLTKTGIRPINTIVDVTNYLMRAYGQPAHAFDYDRIGKKNGVPTMKLRASKKGERLTTLDGKTHTLPGDDIVIEDGTGRLIDLCGIMGGDNSSITDTTTSVILFLQTYDAAHIRRTSMKLGHRTEAASLFEKGVDSELVLPALLTGITLLKEIAGGTTEGPIYDLYPSPYKPYAVSVKHDKVHSYIGRALSDKEITAILSSLGFEPKITKTDITVSVPSFRRDVALDVDVIEEIARIYGYHNIQNRLPQGEMPSAGTDNELTWEEEVKTRLRDWGFTELITYSMISEKTMDLFEQDKNKAYKISNPLSVDWVYMRPHLILSMLDVVRQNLNTRPQLRLFELGNVYKYRHNDLPLEVPTLMVIWTGRHFLKAKGLAESLLNLFGLDPDAVFAERSDQPLAWYNDRRLSIGPFGSLGELSDEKLAAAGIKAPVTRVYLDFAMLAAHAKSMKKYITVPKHPPSVEDLAFIVPGGFAIGPLMTALKHADPKVCAVELLDIHDSTRTLHITYLDPAKTLTSDDIAGIRRKLLDVAKKKFHIDLKTN